MVQASDRSVPNIANRPIRVVLFGGGPTLERAVKEFICRLEQHPDVDFLGAFCQPGEKPLSATAKDLWKRRGLLGMPLLLVQLVRTFTQYLRDPRSKLKLDREIRRLFDRLHFIPDIHHPDVLNRVGSLAPDLGLVYGSPILKPQLFQIPILGTLGIHHGKAPEYRGKKTTFWAMYYGENTAAVTIQKINAGLDSGEIVKQAAVAIDRRSYRSVRNELEQLGLDLYLQAIIEVKEGSATYSPQTGTKRKLCRDPRITDILRFTWRQLIRRFA